MRAPTKRPAFGMRLGNIPIINLRMEFNEHYRLLADDSFCTAINGLAPIEAPGLTWRRGANELLTYILQRAVLGVEAYLPAAVIAQMARCGRLTKEIAEKLRDPFTLGRGGTADNYYNRLPAVLDNSIALRLVDQVLWKTISEFYRHVRNPLFHGAQITDKQIGAVQDAYEVIADAYEWIDGWHNVDHFIDGTSKVIALNRHRTRGSTDADE
jgi:hypothetical protein